MAIFGKLSDFPLAEVLSVIGKRAGQLTLEEADGRRLRLRLQNERLLGLSLEQPIGEPGEIKRALQSIGDASFHFEPTPPMEAKPGQHLPIDQVLASLAPSSRAEPSVHPDTRFVLIRGRTVTLPAELDAFVDAFRNYAFAVYETEFAKYSGQTLRVTGSVPHGPGDELVRTVLVDPQAKSGQSPIEVDFRVYGSGGHFSVVDIVVAGLDLAITEQDDFSSFLAQHNNDVRALTANLRQRAARVRSTGQI